MPPRRARRTRRPPCRRHPLDAAYHVVKVAKSARANQTSPPIAARVIFLYCAIRSGLPANLITATTEQLIMSFGS
jgi:hypothetical protein